ncbi:glycosyltransferase family 4 protein [Sphingomonas metalli]|nr:glycosyltransferase family 4 protein [Sphingomonas metalli]
MRGENSAPRVFVHLPYGADAEAYRRRFEDGREPDASPYGFHRAAEWGFDVSFAEDRLGRVGRWLSTKCRRFLHFDIAHSLANRRAMRRADIIWTMNEWDAIGARLLMALRIVPRRPVIGTAIWVVNWWPTLAGWQRAIYRPLLERLDWLLVHTRPCLDACRERLPGVRSRLMHFGIASETFPPAQPGPDGGPIAIVAAGNDPTRDWDVLLDAFGNDPAVDLVFVNRELPDSLMERYANLRIPRSPSMAEFRRLYASATYIAVPMRENIYSGITVALEAMAMGVPLIATRTGGVPTYVGDGEALFVPPGDAAAWREAVRAQSAEARRAMAARGHDRFRREDYSTRGMMQQFADLTRALLSQDGPKHD